jgi:hypothetical protein
MYLQRCFVLLVVLAGCTAKDSDEEDKLRACLSIDKRSHRVVSCLEFGYATQCATAASSNDEDASFEQQQDEECPRDEQGFVGYCKIVLSSDMFYRRFSYDGSEAEDESRRDCESGVGGTWVPHR